MDLELILMIAVMLILLETAVLKIQIACSLRLHNFCSPEYFYLLGHSAEGHN